MLRYNTYSLTLIITALKILDQPPAYQSNVRCAVLDLLLVIIDPTRSYEPYSIELSDCAPEAGGVRLGDVESGVADAGEVGVEEGKVVDLLQGGNVRVPLHNLLQQSGWVAIQ